MKDRCRRSGAVARDDSSLLGPARASKAHAVESAAAWMWAAVVVLAVALSGCAAQPSALTSQAPPHRTFLGEINADVQYTLFNVRDDLVDVATSPLHAPELVEPGGLLRRPGFYYTLLASGAVLGGAFALDQTARAHVRHVGTGTADGFETGGNFFSYGSAGALYVVGLLDDDDRLRQYEITGFAASGIASLITLGFKSGFGRLRPEQGHGHFAFFDNGDSFVSGAATPVFALAAATSEYFDNDWYAAIPAYAGAVAVGFGRMRKDAHWLSDIAGSALLGIGTTELLLYLHNRHLARWSRVRVAAVTSNLGTPGIAISLSW